MRTIIVSTDLLRESENTVTYAADMACVITCDLMIVNVCPYPVAVTEATFIAYSMEELIADAETKLAALKEKIITRTGGRLKISTVVKQGEVADGIKECCLSVNAYAVVMGRKDASATERVLFGTASVSAMKKLGCPLIVVPSGTVFNGIRNIGLACDFREVIETLPADEIKRIVKELKATLHVLHVSQESADTFSSRTIEESGWFNDLMGDLKPKYQFIQGIDAENKIIEYADKHHLDLLIIIPKKHDLLEKIFQHSHSRQLVLHAHVPIMAIHQ